jgi:hypothetical protein
LVSDAPPDLFRRRPEKFQAGVSFFGDEIYLLHTMTKYIGEPVADVAELADALDSKSSIREDVWVRPPPSAPYK